MSNIIGNVQTVPSVNGTIKYPGSGDSAYQVAVNNGFIGSEKEWLASLKGEKGEQGDKGEKGDSYTITEDDYEEIAGIVEGNIQPQLDEIKDTVEHAEAVAKGRATGYVFDSTEDLDLWLENSENTSKLVLGDNLYIKEVGVPDYWWDGTTKQQLETQKVDLTEYVKEKNVENITKNTLTEFGIGGNCRYYEGDLNNLYGTGFFMGWNLQNKPPIENNAPDQWVYILNMSHNENYQKQLAFDFFSNRFFIRTQVGGIWDNWVQITLA